MTPRMRLSRRPMSTVTPFDQPQSMPKERRHDRKPQGVIGQALLSVLGLLAALLMHGSMLVERRSSGHWQTDSEGVESICDVGRTWRPLKIRRVLQDLEDPLAGAASGLLGPEQPPA